MKTNLVIEHGLAELEREFLRFTKSEVDSLGLAGLKAVIRRFTDAVSELPELSEVVLVKREISYPQEVRAEMRALREALFSKGWRIV
jgi:hypothetical protein